MARRSEPPKPRSANLTPEQMRRALPKLKRRLEELQALDANTVRGHSDQGFKAVELRLDATLTEIFGNDTDEYERFRINSLDLGPLVIGGGVPLHKIQDGYRRGKDQAVTKVQTVIGLFEERLNDGESSPVDRALRAIGDLDIHPEIRRAVESLFKSGHYSNAVEDACKALDALVKIRSGLYDMSGTPLMLKAFSVNKPILRFNVGHTESEKSEQEGMMHLYAGVMLAFRNPRAHEIIKDDPEKALEAISFVSFLAKSLDNATQ